MRVAIDETGQQREARAVRDGGTGQRRNVLAHFGDAAGAYHHGHTGQHMLAIEHAHVVDDERAAFVSSDRR